MPTDGPVMIAPPHLVWLLDCSSSMLESGKQSAAKVAVAEFAAGMRDEAAAGVAPPRGGLPLVSVIGFSANARWICESVPLEDFDWSDAWWGGPPVRATDLGAAFQEVAKRLATPPKSEPNQPAAVVIVLVTDGQPTDDWRGGLRALDATGSGRSAARVAVKIGHDAQEQVLRAFSPQREPCEVIHARYEVLAALYSAAQPREAGSDVADQPQDEDDFGLCDHDEEASVAW